MEGAMILIPIIATAGAYVMVILVVWAVVQGKQQRARIRAEVQSRMIDKFATAPEFVTFLQSPAGKQFVNLFEETPRTFARERILGGMSRSIVLTLLGVAFVALAAVQDFSRGFLIAGFILLALGVGSIISTIVSFRISKAWGLLPDGQPVPTDAQLMQS